MSAFKLQIMASDHMVYDGEASSINLPTTEGRIGVLAHHSNLIMALIPGMVEFRPIGNSNVNERVRSEDRNRFDQVEQWVISDGLLKIENGDVLLLVDTAERPEDIDEARARRAAERAKEELSHANTNRDHVLLEAELSRAMSRIQASTNKHKL